jgi:hypothetical protein
VDSFVQKKVWKISEALDESTEYTMARRKRTTDTTMLKNTLQTTKD